MGLRDPRFPLVKYKSPMGVQFYLVKSRGPLTPIFLTTKLSISTHPSMDFSRLKFFYFAPEYLGQWAPLGEHPSVCKEAIYFVFISPLVESPDSSNM